MPADGLSPIPISVRRAVICLWISVVLAAALTAWQLVGFVATADAVAAAVTGVLTAAVLALVAVKVGAGRGWARWLFLIGYILGSFLFIVFALLAPQMFFSLPALQQASGVAQFALQTSALVLMFTRASRQWFRGPHTARVTSAL